jgi:hypothetical protein
MRSRLTLLALAALLAGPSPVPAAAPSPSPAAAPSAQAVAESPPPPRRPGPAPAPLPGPTPAALQDFAALASLLAAERTAAAAALAAFGPAAAVLAAPPPDPRTAVSPRPPPRPDRTVIQLPVAGTLPTVETAEWIGSTEATPEAGGEAGRWARTSLVLEDSEGWVTDEATGATAEVRLRPQRAGAATATTLSPAAADALGLAAGQYATLSVYLRKAVPGRPAVPPPGVQTPSGRVPALPGSP